MRQEVLTGVERRRRWSEEQKLRIVAEVEVGGARVTDVARRHDISRQHIYQWRKELRRKGVIEDERPRFLPVELNDDSEGAVRGEATEPRSADLTVEIGLLNGRCVRVRLDVPEALLRRVIRIAEVA